MSLFEEYKDYCKKYNAVWKYLNSCSKDLNTIVSEVCSLRNYFGSEEKWAKLLEDVGIVFVSSETCDYSKLQKEEFKDLALFSKEGHFLLDERYILPVRDMLGNIIALIGWYPDSKKYITTPSKFFIRNCLFFGMEQVGKTGLGKDYFLVEGVFDALAIRSLGFNAVAQMGIADSDVKILLYGLFKRIIAIPDNDSEGRRVLRTNAWNLPQNASYLRWSGDAQIGEETIYIKDIDKLISLFTDEDVVGLLNGCLEEKGRVIKVSL